MSERATDLSSERVMTAEVPPERRVPARPAIALLSVGLALLAAYAIHLGRGLTFAVDEWDILAHHVHGNFLTPYNGHLSIIPIGIYQGFAHTVGIGSYRPYAMVGLVVFLAIAVAFFATHRRRVDPMLAAIAALAIAWSWAAEWNILYGFLVNFDLPVLMLVVGWWAIRSGTLRRDLIAVAAVTVALATSSVGVVVAFAIGTELIVSRAPVRRLVRFAPPVVLWILWWIFGHDPTKVASVTERMTYAWNVSVAILAGFTLGWKPGAALSAVVIVAILGIAWKRWHTVDAHVIAIGLSLAFFVALSAYSRAGDIALNPPDSARYVWVGDVLIIAALLWCVRGRQVTTVPRMVAAAIVLIGAIGLVGHLRDYRSYILDYTARTRPFLVGAEASGPRADPDRILPLNLIPVTVGQYLDLVDAVGSPVAGVGDDSLGSAPARLDADRLLIAEEVRVESGPRPSCPSGWQRMPHRRGADLALAPGDLLALDQPSGVATLRMRRLALQYPDRPQRTVAPGRRAVLKTPVDDSTLPWHVRITGNGVVAICRAP